jgi:hypothetical protein
MRFIKKNYLFLIPLILFLSLRLTNLGTDITNTDAIRWHKRSDNFYRALREGDWKNTFQHYQPGVTLMWLNSTTKYTLQRCQLANNSPQLELNHTGNYKTIHSTSKTILVLTLSILLIYQLHLVRNVFDDKTAFIFGMLMAMEPFLIGIDRFFHLTSLETYLIFSSLLTLLNSKKNISLYIAGILFGLAILTKTSALIFLPIPIILLLRTEKPIEKLFKFFIPAIVIFVSLFPAIWVSPRYVFEKLMDGITGGIAQDTRQTGVTPILFYPTMLMYKLSPLTLVLFAGVLVNVKKLKQEKILYILGMFLIYLLAFSMSVKKIDRYLISLIPPLLLLCAHYLATLKVKKQIVYITAISLFTIWVGYIYHPHYSAFFSPVLGGTTKALSLGVYGNKGEYFSEAARYLNEKGRDTYAWVPNNHNSLAYYFKGNLEQVHTGETNFVVISINNLDKKPESCGVFEKGFGPRNIEVVQIYKCNYD